MKGKVIFFNNAKGWGFLKPDDGSLDIFCHYSAIQVDGYKMLKADQRVEFDVEQGKQGKQAANVVVISE